jgi:hypothetical protein
MNPQVFISYRRDDSGPEALLLRKALEERFGEGFVFVDTSSIKPGTLWPDEIEQQLRSAKVIVAIMGPEWLRAADEFGRRRIDQESDWVRRELVTALTLKRDLMVVLVRDAEVPPPEALPEPVKDLVKRQAISIRRDYWDNDIKPLLEQIEQLLKVDPASLFAERPPLKQLQNRERRPGVDRQTRAMFAKIMERLEEIWIGPVLDQSLQRVAWMTLKLDWQDNQVETAANTRRILRDHSIQSLDSEEDMSALFKELGRQLLILGEPGAGKTTVLLKLAKALLARARASEAEPIPIALPLDAWVGKYRNFQSWFVGTLKEWYGVPPTLGREWLTQGRFILLLDGLDEVEVRYRQDCVNAINKFADEMGILLPGIVVTSRYSEYEALPQKLSLDEAVCLSPLSPNQIDKYLADGGPKLNPLREALRQDAVLMQLGQNPFMLTVLILAHAGRAPPTLAEGNDMTIASRRGQLFDDYIRSAFQRPDKPQGTRPDRETLGWLKKLATQMRDRETKFFSVESLQPAWLESRWLQLLYLLATRTIGVGVTAFVVAYLLAAWSFVWEPIYWAAIAGCLAALADFAVLRWNFRWARSSTVRLLAVLTALAAAAVIYIFTWSFFVGHPKAWLPYCQLRNIEWVLAAALLAAACFASPNEVLTAEIKPATRLGWSWRDASRRTLWSSVAMGSGTYLVVFLQLLIEGDLELGGEWWWPLGGMLVAAAAGLCFHRWRKKKISFLALVKLIMISLFGASAGTAAGYLAASEFSFNDELFFTPVISTGYVLVSLPLFTGLKLRISAVEALRGSNWWHWLKEPLRAAGLGASFVLIIALLMLAAALCFPEERKELLSGLDSMHISTARIEEPTDAAAVMETKYLQQMKYYQLSTNGNNSWRDYRRQNPFFLYDKAELNQVLTTVPKMSPDEARRWFKTFAERGTPKSVGGFLALTVVHALLLFAVIGFFRYGGLDAVQHWLIRFLMIRSGRLPTAPAAFLQYAAKLILLRRRGSNYEFIHATFLDHVAVLPDSQVAAISTSEAR